MSIACETIRPHVKDPGKLKASDFKITWEFPTPDTQEKARRDREEYLKNVEALTKAKAVAIAGGKVIHKTVRRSEAKPNPFLDDSPLFPEVVNTD